MSLVCGVGVNDADYPVQKRDGTYCPFHRAWTNMIKRCYSKKALSGKNEPAHVCDDWLTFSKFKSWMESQDWKGKDLDKDLLIYDNKVYSPDTCLFIPHEINLLIKSTGYSGKLLGAKVSNGSWYSGYYENEEYVYLGVFPDELSAHNAYVLEKSRVLLRASESQLPLVKSAMVRRAMLLSSMIERGEIVKHL